MLRLYKQKRFKCDEYSHLCLSIVYDCPELPYILHMHMAALNLDYYLENRNSSMEIL